MVRKKSDRLEWMYSQGLQQSGGTTEDKEAYLLGKKRVDRLIEQGKGVEEVISPPLLRLFIVLLDVGPKYLFSNSIFGLWSHGEYIQRYYLQSPR